MSINTGGDRPVELPSLNVEHNYPHLLSELVMRLWKVQLVYKIKADMISSRYPAYFGLRCIQDYSKHKEGSRGIKILNMPLRSRRCSSKIGSPGHRMKTIISSKANIWNGNPEKPKEVEWSEESCLYIELSYNLFTSHKSFTVNLVNTTGIDLCQTNVIIFIRSFLNPAKPDYHTFLKQK